MNDKSTQKTLSTTLEPVLALAEDTIELPADEQNGGCIVHYREPYDKYEMRVMLVDEKREGEALVHNDGVLVAVLEYKDGLCIREVQYEDKTKGFMTWDLSLTSAIRSLDDDTQRMLTSILLGEWDDVLTVYDIDQACMYSVLKTNTLCYQLKWTAHTSSMVVADLNTHEMSVYENGDQIDIIHASIGCIDLDVNGRRWEGEIQNGKPYGYGIVYDEDGREEYSGFMMNGMKMCHGTEYYSDINRTKYTGCYCNDKRFGKGVLCNRNGCVDYEGLWKNDKPVSPAFDENTIDHRTESIHISTNSFSDVSSFILPRFIQSLKCVVIDDDCFGNVRLVEVDGLPSLESISIAERSFSLSRDDGSLWVMEYNDGMCRIANCPKLKSIQIDNYSFSDFTFFELTNLPSLESLVIGECCFVHTQSLSLTSCCFECCFI